MKRKPISDYELEQMYCEMLDEVHGTVKVAGYEYETSRVLAEIDPVAFRCGLSDYISFQIEDNIIEEVDGEYFLVDDTNS